MWAAWRCLGLIPVERQPNASGIPKLIVALVNRTKSIRVEP